MSLEFFLLILFIILSGILSATEVSLNTLDKVKLKAMEDDKRFASRQILKLKEHPQRVLIAILMSNQVVNILATVIATLWAVHTFGEGNIGFATFVFAIALLLFGNIIPKTSALRFAEVYARFIAYPMLGFMFIVRPLIWVVEFIVGGFVSIFKIKHKYIPVTTDREIEAMLDMGAEEGVIDEDEQAFMKHILKFNKTEAGDIMTLLKNINAVNINSSKEDLISFFAEQTHNYFPAYEDSLNNIKGIISIHYLIELFASKRKFPLHQKKLITPVVVPKTTSLLELFRILKEAKRNMAIVVDEHGQTVGLITMGDMFEDITGLKANKEVPEPKIEKIEKNLWRADGEIEMGRVNEELNLELTLPEHQTISLAILQEIKRFPELNEKIVIESIEVEITRIEKNVIKKVHLRKMRKK